MDGNAKTDFIDMHSRATLSANTNEGRNAERNGYRDKRIMHIILQTQCTTNCDGLTRYTYLAQSITGDDLRLAGTVTVNRDITVECNERDAAGGRLHEGTFL